MIDPRTHKIDAIEALRQFCLDTYGVISGFKESRDFIETLNFPEPYTLASFLKQFPEARLTGSRYFGNNRPNSDYDYFLSYGIGNVSKLQSAGFTKANDPKTYGDSMAASTMIKLTADGNHIHVQLVYDVNVKTSVQNYLDNLPYLLRFAFLESPKTEQRNMWNWAYKQVTGGN